MFTSEEYKGEFIGNDADGSQVRIGVTRDGQYWWLNAPEGRRMAQLSRRTIGDLWYEVETVYGLTDLKFRAN